MNWPLTQQMVRHSFAQPWALWLFVLLPAMGVLGFLARRRRRRVLMRLGRLPALAALTEKRSPWRRLRSLCWLTGIAALILGIAGPQWGREAEPSTAPGRDLVIVFDVSRSMLADDVLPSRQERAKEMLRELMDTLQKRGGHRVALVAFAARADVICPLTHDYDHFRDKLADLDAAQLPPEMRPGEGSVSGTRIGAGLELAVLEAHDARMQGYQDILLISDGDDPTDGKKSDREPQPEMEWRDGANKAREHGIPIYTVGVGDPDKGGKIPSRDGYYLSRDGKPVVTKLTEKPLKWIADRTKGRYIPARTGPAALGEWFRTTIEPGPKQEMLDDALPQYQQRYPWFFGAALFFLAADLVLRRTLRKKKPAAKPAPRPPKPLAA